MAAQLDTMPQGTDEDVCPLPRIHGAVSVVRRRARAVLADWNLSPDIAEDALLVISELVTNAIVHALAPAELRLSWTLLDGLSALRIEVTDAGTADQARQSDVGLDPDEHGRGLTIVAALSARCGTRVHSGGVTRWADLFAA
jgi:anti-sigma regulatory factor (Ser/Thr protein kinase)